ncbi:MAG: redox-regulated ATPase YchF [Buchnera aphidicola (Periphyllus acericola)]|uniref:redox-regulated ATPase YchF n=1 Tax=Buchnera aphidicola TaxID=9 RepID=UPI0030D60580|nr:redox-regulated ATPase YchF [Buchnera aphidicola (Periphyllus acericola)]
MGVQCGIIGLPNVGKSTIFNILTKMTVPSLNFPFCTISPNIGFSIVYDKRLINLKKIVSPKKVIFSSVKLVDIAGLVKGASKGEGLGNKFLQEIKKVNALIHVVRCFKDESIIHVQNKVNPINDIDVINTELIFSDINVCEKSIIILNNSKNIDENLIYEEKSLLNKCLLNLKNFIFLRKINFSQKEMFLIKKFNFLTLKPMLYLININIDNKKNVCLNNVKEFLKNDIYKTINPNSLKETNKYDNRLFDLSKIIHSIYKILKLKTFFTVGKKEIRAWSFIKNSKCIDVSKIIHSDFKKGFIRAKVIRYKDFIRYKNENSVKKAGKLKLEGKNYLVQDGDIIHFLFNL